MTGKHFIIFPGFPGAVGTLDHNYGHSKVMLPSVVVGIVLP